jgi:hypothetical protein
VSLLAHRHGITATLSQGSPGTTVDVLLPSSLFGPIDLLAGDAGPTMRVEGPAVAPMSATLAPTAPEPIGMPSLATVSFDAAALREDVPVAEPIGPPSFDLAVHGQAQPEADHDAPAVAAAGFPSALPTLDPTTPPAGWTDPYADNPFAAPAPDTVMPPPPPPVAPAPSGGEFDRPLAPPLTAEGPSRLPVTPADAHPAPAPPTISLEAVLPTRTPSTGPDGGPDRLATFREEQSVTATSSPSALQAALAAFDARRNGDHGALPTRARADGQPDPGADDPGAAQSRLDPDALRERLRAFQTEFRTGTTGTDSTQPPPTIEPNDSTNADLGGDRR